MHNIIADHRPGYGSLDADAERLTVAIQPKQRIS